MSARLNLITRLSLLTAGACLLFLALFTVSCDKLVPRDTPEQKVTGDSVVSPGQIVGFYLGCEGNMTSNKGTIDYMDLITGTYSVNVYSQVNSPDSSKIYMGDVVNDVLVYGSKLYVVVNLSHKIEVLDLKTAKRIGKINFNNGRYLIPHKGKIYGSSYVGLKAVLNPSGYPDGEVVEIDTATFSVMRRWKVGQQPDHLTIYKDVLYVANSGGYQAGGGGYAHSISAIDLTSSDTMSLTLDLPLDCINPNECKIDRYGNMWLTSRGDYAARKPHLVKLVNKTGRIDGYQVERVFTNIPIISFDLVGDTIYYYNEPLSAFRQLNIVTGRVSPCAAQKLLDSVRFDHLYMFRVNPQNGDFYAADALSYVVSGKLYCCDKDGNWKWSVTTSDIPGHLAFVYAPE